MKLKKQMDSKLVVKPKAGSTPWQDIELTEYELEVADLIVEEWRDPSTIKQFKHILCDMCNEHGVDTHRIATHLGQRRRK